jgi:hypothetical protein
MYHSLPDGRSQLENRRREKDLYQMRRFSIDAKITVRDTTLKNVVTNQGSFGRLFADFLVFVENLLAPNFQ